MVSFFLITNMMMFEYVVRYYRVLIIRYVHSIVTNIPYSPASCLFIYKFANAFSSGVISFGIFCNEKVELLRTSYDRIYERAGNVVLFYCAFFFSKLSPI